MKIASLLEQIENDSVMQLHKLTEHSLDIPKLSAKYQKILYNESMLHKKLMNSLNNTRKNVHDYYKGLLPDDVYKERPLNRKPTASELEMYIKSDADYQKYQLLVDDAKAKIGIIEDFIKQLNQRSFMIKNAIDWEKFQNGGH